jgi:hypothetical protein
VTLAVRQRIGKGDLVGKLATQGRQRPHPRQQRRVDGRIEFAEIAGAESGDPLRTGLEQRTGKQRPRTVPISHAGQRHVALEQRGNIGGAFDGGGNDGQRHERRQRCRPAAWRRVLLNYSLQLLAVAAQLLGHVQEAIVDRARRNNPLAAGRIV